MAVVGCAVIIGAVPPAIHPHEQLLMRLGQLVGCHGVLALSDAIVGL